MELNSELILASKNSVTGTNLYTFVLTYPRVILAEINTHRMLSRNTASSRAIPSKKQRERVLQQPFIPISIGANQKGMQAGEELSGWRRYAIEMIIRGLRYPNVGAVWAMDKLGAHKQVINRYIEPWTWTQQVVTATDWKNVFKLRNHKDAEPHFHTLAEIMQRQVEYVERLFTTLAWEPGTTVDRSLTRTWAVASVRSHWNPQLGVGAVQALRPGEWHLPFVTEDEIVRSRIIKEGADWTQLKQISTARCARVSYYLPESNDKSNLKRDIELCERLSSSGHWSPFEHVATPIPTDTYLGNFRSWKQYRKEFDTEAGGDRVLASHGIS
jgi:thymidylate synthase ThyX